MCFTVKLSVDAQTLSNRYNAPLNKSVVLSEKLISGFAHHTQPVLAESGQFSSMHWGLVPSWVKSREQATSLQNKTLNARAETIFSKPSFRSSIRSKRLIIPVSSFLEYHHNSDGSKTAYEISVKDEKIFSLAGLWAEWKGPESGRSYFSFTVITCDANPLMAEIHNSKQRMPVILSRESEAKWLSSLTDSEISEILTPFDDSQMSAELYL